MYEYYCKQGACKHTIPKRKKLTVKSRSSKYKQVIKHFPKGGVSVTTMGDIAFVKRINIAVRETVTRKKSRPSQPQHSSCGPDS